MTVVAIEPSELEARCLAWLEARGDGEHPVALLSAGPVSDDARHHILAARPLSIVEGNLTRGPTEESGRVRVTDAAGNIVEEVAWPALLDVVRRLEAEHSPGVEPGSPFGGGFIGYLGYDLAWLFEYGLPRYLPRVSELPDVWLGWYDAPLVADRIGGTVSGPAAAIADFLDLTEPRGPAPIEVQAFDGLFHREEYEAAVDRIRSHCIAGDIFQADMSRRIALEVSGTSLDLFKRLVGASPASFMAYLGLGRERAVVSASPEEFVRVRGRDVRSRPIKGTRPRGATPAADARLRDELLASEKDRAELTMIVDLMRNDLGRVAAAGSVEVVDYPVLYSLPQVHHLFATVAARLDAGKDAWDLLAASFPPGSISGAPKPKAIEILELVERSRRGVYTGSIGYVDPGGNAHWNVAIRTAEFAAGALRFGVGGGITALSDPALEFDETTDKARGLAVALGIEGLA